MEHARALEERAASRPRWSACDQGGDAREEVEPQDAEQAEREQRMAERSATAAAKQEPAGGEAGLG